MTSTKKNTVQQATLWLIYGGIDIKMVATDGKPYKIQGMSFTEMKEFTFDRKKGSITPCETKGSKHGDRGFIFKLGATSFKLYPQAKGHFFGSVAEDRGPISSYDDMLEAYSNA